MKNRILFIVLMCLMVAGIAFPQAADTIFIPLTPNGQLETIINGDTLNGARAHPNRVYMLHKDGVYVQNAGIIFKGGTLLNIIGEKGGGYPVVQMQPVNGWTPAT